MEKEREKKEQELKEEQEQKQSIKDRFSVPASYGLTFCCCCCRCCRCCFVVIIIIIILVVIVVVVIVFRCRQLGVYAVVKSQFVAPASLSLTFSSCV